MVRPTVSEKRTSSKGATLVKGVNVGGTVDWKKNPMREIHIQKLCMNICVGESGDRLTRAGKVLADLISPPKEKGAEDDDEGREPVFSR
eukprot:gene13677-3998_t